MILKNPLDMHLHLRDNSLLHFVTPFSARSFKAAVIMPNLVPPLCDLPSLKAYKQRIIKASKDENFTPLMTLFFQNYDERFLEEAKTELFGIKLYPAGITTNSTQGVSSFDLERLKPTLEVMSALEIPLLVHGETNDFVMDRESNFAAIYQNLAKHFPKLKIVMEHISTQKLARLVKDYENLYATITLHHLILTLDDVLGSNLNPHLFCKPIAKTYKDKEALCELAFSGFEKVMFGSDSAPHLISQKECCACAAGIFSSPVALSLLAELFTKHSNQDNLQKFLSENAIRIYNFKFQKEKIVHLKQQEWQVPQSYKDENNELVPFMAGCLLQFQEL
ncbi:dihydroorotase [Campylobacter sp. MIT 21-1685]|uniref:dihydroorotase n=1 Tax=unclassified Campylobacter TaxID=2593542 RepID=UPI00224B4B4B|nr:MULTISPECIES: dihydroorotase [unclassified Campylobacter]MCX2683068.1 dihydroorotase [Campylobacter sp. MIT 21-1684]MCX2751350.1 dihydroorotase [Campylobacter sp. MIT 21-1682]MCX2807549.1 dihydroorotase [Campylobacter sp. MIT 21-1685]